MKDSNFSEETMAKGKPLTVTLHIGGKEVESLTEEQACQMTERLSKAMSLYYSQHLAEYQKIKSN